MITSRIIQSLRRLFGYTEPVKEPYLDTVPQTTDSPSSWMERELGLAKSRKSQYDEYDKMDEDDLVMSVLDLYTEDSTQPDSLTGKIIWIESSSEEIKKLAEECLDGLNITDRLGALVRDVAKYGDAFDACVYGYPDGLVNLVPIDPKDIDRHTDSMGRLKGFTTSKTKDVSRPWDAIHYRLLGKDREGQYGTSIIHNARRIYRKLRMMEDSLLYYRLRRMPQRDVYYVDCGTASPAEALRIVSRWREMYKKRQYLNTATSEMRYEINPFALSDDIFWPISANKNSRVEPLPAGSAPGDIFDVEYFLKRFFSTVRIPPAYMGFEDLGGGIIEIKSSLSQQDIRFARGCRRLQTAIIIGVTHLIKIHLAMRGIDPTMESSQFSVRMTPPSSLDEIQRQEIYNIRADITERLARLTDTLPLKKAPWMTFLLKHFIGFTDEMLKTFVEQDEDGFSGDDDLSLETRETLMNLAEAPGSESRRILDGIHRRGYIPSNRVNEGELPTQLSGGDNGNRLVGDGVASVATLGDEYDE